ncbi:MULTISPECIES: hypothetical protein [unclassified Idiomarina]|jgi:hypothetical protein|uniref:hypothetical protein n=1 Tax=unclassified Idiomarina TaxID=2614829 RepID=UPI00257C2AE9|nr:MULTISPECIES: hypothetical protein [unclassified Idiomarina]|tara:strand:+ start:9297 stop:9740 length:444 start_codon:yes stop_codon:yes gene_type:complete
MRTVFTFVTVFAVIAMSGCTVMDGNATITGNTRPAISPSEVHVYRAKPDNFEEIAIVSASAGHDFKKSSTLMNETIQRLKEEAAKVGANGLILTKIDERDAPSVTTSYGSATSTGTSGSEFATGKATSVNRGDAYTRLSGIAVYVLE